MSPADKKSLTKYLNDTILTLLGGPRGDPDDCHLQGAAKAFICLKILKLPIKDEAETIAGLRDDNVYKHDFLDDEGWPKEMDSA